MTWPDSSASIGTSSPDALFLTAEPRREGSSNHLEHTARTVFGLREFKTKGTQFTINGRTTFLRGKHDACVFPLTGHPPMDVDAWRQYFRTCKSYGINHVRFHTWCPPEAAFAAADDLGVYLQPELPNWSAFRRQIANTIATCGRRPSGSCKRYGNHPSFVMLSLGNEMGGDAAAMAKLVKHLHDIDPRHLYAQGSNNFFWNPILAPGDDYWTTVRTSVDHGLVKSVRGSFATVDAPLGHVQTGPADTMTDYRRAIAGVPIPVIGHEVGQYKVFPDFREMAKYTGVLRARNLEIFRENLRAKGMLDQAEQFQQASGALAVLCYREEIEAALRTPGFGGFQLLDLQDFPGQGTALVGILDAFMDSKGLIEPKAWREFCSEVVPLVRMKKYAWTSGETFTAGVEVANYGPADLRRVVPAWSLTDSQARTVASGELPAIDVAQGSVLRRGDHRRRFGVPARPAEADPGGLASRRHRREPLQRLGLSGEDRCRVAAGRRRRPIARPPDAANACRGRAGLADAGSRIAGRNAGWRLCHGFLVLVHVPQPAGHDGDPLRPQARRRWRSFPRSFTATGNGSRSSPPRGRSSSTPRPPATGRSSR